MGKEGYKIKKITFSDKEIEELKKKIEANLEECRNCTNKTDECIYDGFRTEPCKYLAMTKNWDDAINAYKT
jgi:hypothetical protein